MPFRNSWFGGLNVDAGDPVDRFIELHRALQTGRGLFGDRVPPRFAALTLVTAHGQPEQLAQATWATTRQLNGALGWFSQVPSALRPLLAALLVKHGDEPTQFVEMVKRVRRTMRHVGLRRCGVYEVLAALALRERAGSIDVEPARIDRLAAIYRQMKRYRWLTGAEQLVACALLAVTNQSPDVIGQGLAATYDALRTESGVWGGDHLQTAAHLLYLSGLAPHDAAERFVLLRAGFKAAGQGIRSAQYDEVAMMCFLAQPAELVVQTVSEYTRRLAAEIRFMRRSMAFSLASGLAYVRLLGRDKALGPLVDAKALLDMQAIVTGRSRAYAIGVPPAD